MARCFRPLLFPALVLAVAATAGCPAAVAPVRADKVPTKAPSPQADAQASRPAAVPSGAAGSRSPGPIASSPGPSAAPVSPTASAGPAMIAASPVALAPARRAGVLAAMREALAASRASRVSGVLGEASGVISNHGGGILSNNGGNLVSDAGGAYRLTQAASPAPASPVTRVSKSATRAYEVTMGPGRAGRYVAYDRAGYEALPPERRAEALLDAFRWDDFTVGFLTPPDPLRFTTAYTLVKETSTRIPFADRLEALEVLRIDPKPDGEYELPTGGRADYVPERFTFAFDLDVAPPGGTAERARFEATATGADLETVPEEGGGTVTFPKRLALTGTNARGRYEGRTGGGDQDGTTIVHVAADGARTTLEIVGRPDGTSRRTITAEAAQVRVVVDVAADRTGAGRLEDLAGAPLGTLAIVTAGLATVTYADGATDTFALE